MVQFIPCPGQLGYDFKFLPPTQAETTPDASGNNGFPKTLKPLLVPGRKSRVD